MMTTSLLLMLVSSQVAAETCGSISHPCYCHTVLRDGDSTEARPPAEPGIVVPAGGLFCFQALSQCEVHATCVDGPRGFRASVASPEEFELSQLRSSNARLAEDIVTCQAALSDEKKLSNAKKWFFAYGSTVLGLFGLFWMLSRLDQIVGAWRRSELKLSLVQPALVLLLIGSPFVAALAAWATVQLFMLMLPTVQAQSEGRDVATGFVMFLAFVAGGFGGTAWLHFWPKQSGR